jgi:hypothetical protein
MAYSVEKLEKNMVLYFCRKPKRPEFRTALTMYAHQYICGQKRTLINVWITLFLSAELTATPLVDIASLTADRYSAFSGITIGAFR